VVITFYALSRQRTPVYFAHGGKVYKAPFYTPFIKRVESGAAHRFYCTALPLTRELSLLMPGAVKALLIKTAPWRWIPCAYKNGSFNSARPKAAVTQSIIMETMLKALDT
jgi:hypothetical protein